MSAVLPLVPPYATLVEPARKPGRLSPLARALLDGILCGLRQGDVAIVGADADLACELAATGATVLAFASEAAAFDILRDRLMSHPNAVAVAALPVISSPDAAPAAPSLPATQARLRVAPAHARPKPPRQVCLLSVLRDITARRQPMALREELRAHRLPDRLGLLHLDLGPRSWAGLAALDRAGLLEAIGCTLVPPPACAPSVAARARLAPDLAARHRHRLRLDWA